MTATSNGQAKLLIWYNNNNLAGFFIQNHLGHFRRLQSVHQESWLIFIPGDNVDFFALKLIHNRLHPAAAHPNAGTNRINGAVIRDHSDLRARSRITSHGFDLNDAIIDFWHFHFEQFRHEFWRRPRQEDLRAALLTAHFLDVDANTVVGAIAFTANFFIAAQHSFTAANIDNDIAIFFALHQTIDNRASTVLEFFILTIPLGFADFLQNDLLGRLRGDAAHFNRRNLFNILLTHFWVLHILLGLLNGEFRLVIFQQLFFHNSAHAGESRSASFPVNRNSDIHFCAIARLCRPR